MSPKNISKIKGKIDLNEGSISDLFIWYRLGFTAISKQDGGINFT